MPTKTQIAWLAGLFEGEGTVSNAQRGVTLSITMTDHDVLLNALEVTGLGRVNGPYRNKKKSNKPYWRWTVCNWKDVKTVGKWIMPFLGLRRFTKLTAVLAAAPVRRVITFSPLCNRRSYAGYARHVKLKERPCKACHKAYLIYMQKFREKRRGRVLCDN